MDVFFNEKSLEDYTEINNVIVFLRKTITTLENAGINIYSNLQYLQQWESEWDLYFDSTEKRYLSTIKKYLKKCPSAEGRFYYHFFKHQDFNLSISENIQDSSISHATDLILNGHTTAVINLPNSEFDCRPHLPILKSSHDSTLVDKLANIPCFNSPQKLVFHIWLHQKLKPSIKSEDEFVMFSKEYLSFIETYDFESWKPRSFKNDKELIQEIAFPASSNEYIRQKLSTWKITKKSIEENIIEYKLLGSLILEMHGYQKNPKISRHFSREVYEGGYGNYKLLISLDLENGTFEVIDSSGTHIGVYGYDGAFKKKYDDQIEINNHSFIGLKKDMFLFP